jgi:hypothetical protein
MQHTHHVAVEYMQVCTHLLPSGLQQLSELEGQWAHVNLLHNVLAPVVQLKEVVNHTCTVADQGCWSGMQHFGDWDTWPAVD